MYSKWIELGIQKGLKDLEIYAVTSKKLQLAIYQGKIDQHVKSNVSSVRLKAIYRGKVAVASFEDISDQTVDYMLDKLIESAKVVTVKEPAIIYKGSKSYPVVVDETFDFNSVPLKNKVDMLVELESLILKNKLCQQVQTTVYQEIANQTTLINSKGLNLTRSYTFAYCYALGVFKRGDDIKTAHELKAVKNFAEFDVKQIAKKTISKGVAAVGGSSLKTGVYPVVFSPEMFSQIIDVYSDIFSGEAAYRNLTSLTDKVGTKIANESFTLIDDPLHKKAFFKNPFDDEGVACRKREIIKDGVFKGFVHNLKTAALFKVRPTGNGFGGSIAFSNLYLKPGTKKFASLIAPITDGVYITELIGLHAGVNEISGDFSLQAGGFRIEDGKVTTPVKMIVVSGNFYKMINQIEEIGKDIEFFVSGVGSPHVLISGLSIAGEK